LVLRRASDRNLITAEDVIRLFQEGQTWTVSYEGGVLRRSFAAREEAQQYARKLAQIKTPSCLMVLGEDGVVVYGETFPSTG
jgi:hypothetical protein